MTVRHLRRAPFGARRPGAALKTVRWSIPSETQASSAWLPSAGSSRLAETAQMATNQRERVVIGVADGADRREQLGRCTTAGPAVRSCGGGSTIATAAPPDLDVADSVKGVITIVARVSSARAAGADSASANAQAASPLSAARSAAAARTRMRKAAASPDSIKSASRPIVDALRPRLRLGPIGKLTTGGSERPCFLVPAGFVKGRR